MPPRGAALIAQGGGPTHVLNASLYGVVRECARHAEITSLYGARYGILGVFREDFVDLLGLDAGTLRAVGESPGSALGSCRRDVREDDYARLVEVFRARGIRYFFYCGGNGSMETARRVDRLALEMGYEMRVIGIPKTIDNDLEETDHTPGYGSAARFFACAARDIGEDIRSLPERVSVIETMGRNVGWLVAATSLARRAEDDPPQLIYLPERPLAEERLAADVERVYRRLGYCVVAVCEGQTDAAGGVFGADAMAPDGFERRLTSNLGHVLAQLLARRLKLRTRSEKPGVLGRSSRAFVSAVDREEARQCGEVAVAAALGGASGVMVALRRESVSPYRSATSLVPLDRVAGRERTFPAEWIHPTGNDVLAAYREYAAPLTGAIEAAPRLDVRR